MLLIGGAAICAALVALLMFTTPHASYDGYYIQGSDAYGVANWGACDFG